MSPERAFAVGAEEHPEEESDVVATDGVRTYLREIATVSLLSAGAK